MKCQGSDICKSIIIWYSLKNEPRKIFYNSSEVLRMNQFCLVQPDVRNHMNRNVFEIKLLSACFLGYILEWVSCFTSAALLSAWLLGLEMPGLLDSLLRVFCFSAIPRPAGLEWWAEHPEHHTAFGRSSVSMILIGILEKVSQELLKTNQTPKVW